MEHPHDPYHVRPFPQQPHRGGKELVAVLDEIETACSEKIPDFESLRILQERMHQKTNTFNDDRLVDMIRQLSQEIDHFREKPEKETLEKIIRQLLKVRIELKHL